MNYDNNNDGYTKIDHYNQKRVEALSAAYLTVLKELGEDPNREGLLKTPERVAKAMQFLTHGYDLDPEKYSCLRNSGKITSRW